jgi:hypothetical protein
MIARLKHLVQLLRKLLVHDRDVDLVRGPWSTPLIAKTFENDLYSLDFARRRERKKCCSSTDWVGGLRGSW